MTMKKCKYYFFRAYSLILIGLMSLLFLLGSCSSATPPKKDDPNSTPPKKEEPNKKPPTKKSEPINPLYGPRSGIIINKNIHN
jgi:hypothetical protein